MPLREERLLENIKSRSLFGYVQGATEVPVNLGEAFPNFPPIFENIIVCSLDIGPFMKEYAKKKGLSAQPRRILISSYFLENGTVFKPLLLFCLYLGLICKKTYRFVQYTPVNCFNNFGQSAVNARREGDENTNSSAVAETMKLLANICYDYPILDRSRHTVTKYLSDEKTHGVINNKKCKHLHLGYINDQLYQLYEVVLVKSEIDHREPIIVGIFVLQFAKLRMLEQYYNFFEKNGDVTKIEELELDIDLLYVALSEQNLYDCIPPAMREESNSLQSGDCSDEFSAIQ